MKYHLVIPFFNLCLFDFGLTVQSTQSGHVGSDSSHSVKNMPPQNSLALDNLRSAMGRPNSQRACAGQSESSSWSGKQWFGKLTDST